MNEIYRTRDKIIFYVVLIVTLSIGLVIYSKVIDESNELSRYKFLWILAVVCLCLYLLRELILKKRIRQHNGTNIIQYTNSRLIGRWIIVVMFYFVSWFLSESDLGSILIFVGPILQNVLPKPSLELVYGVDKGIIYKGKLIEFDQIENATIEDSVVKLKLQNRREEKLCDFIKQDNAQVFYNYIEEKNNIYKTGACDFR